MNIGDKRTKPVKDSTKSKILLGCLEYTVIELGF